MKMIIAIFMCVSAWSAELVVSDGSVVYENRKAFLKKYFENVKKNPNLRVYDGKIYDLTAVQYADDYSIRKSEVRRIDGKVAQIDGDSVYVNPNWNSDIRIYIQHFPGARELVDGSRIEGVAFAAGNHAYRSVLGANLTVLAFDYGKPIQPKETPVVVYRVAPNGVFKLDKKESE